eukprot:TRINITY_DN3518_c1_g1_i2.p1 TRINITY_DN3518_c1_g1~~TRINITY_DN3518_c1_g1_i2.p1  ORF type:complete len:200 (-),score=39.14 TRINITY_DN3518_c1_g1_i2:231-773(-)
MFCCCAPSGDGEEVQVTVSAISQEDILLPVPTRKVEEKPPISTPPAEATELKKKREEIVTEAPAAKQAEATSSYPETAKQAEAKAAVPREFDVKLEKVDGMGLGLELEQRSLKVKQVLKTGLVNRYNETVGEAGSKVQPGYMLSSFNGVDGDPLAILNIIKARVPTMKAGDAINLRFRTV